MNTNLPISQADLEAMRIGSAHAAAEREWSWMMTVDAVSGNLQASTDFRRALVKAGLLQDNCRTTAIFSLPWCGHQFFIPTTFYFLQRRRQMAKQKTTEVRSTALNLTDKFEIPLLSIAIQHEVNRINETQRRTKDSRKKLNQNFALETYEGILRAIEEAQ